MTRARLGCLLLLMLFGGASLVWDIAVQQRAFPYGMEMTDFKGVYYGA